MKSKFLKCLFSFCIFFLALSYMGIVGAELPLIITSTPVKAAVCGIAYSYQIEINLQGDVIEYQLLECPSGMDIEPIIGLITWLPHSNSERINHVRVLAENTFTGESTTQEFFITLVDENHREFLIADNFRVDQNNITHNAYECRIAAGKDRFIIVWSDSRLSNTHNIFGRVLNKEGTPIGNDFRIDQYSGSTYLTESTVAVNDLDHAMIAYFTENMSRIIGRVFDVSGEVPVALGDEFIIRKVFGGLNSLSISADNMDNFVLTWEDNSDGEVHIFGKKFDKDGNSISDVFRVDQSEENTIFIRKTDVDTNSKGGFIVTYGTGSRYDEWSDILARCFDRNNQGVGDEFAVDQKINIEDTNQSSRIAIDSQDNFIIVWRNVADYQHIYARSFDPQGNPLRNSFRIDRSPDGLWILNPLIDILDNDNFIIVWCQKEFTNYTICGSLFDVLGNSLGPDFVIPNNTILSGEQGGVAALDNQFITCWIEKNGDAFETMCNIYNVATLLEDIGSAHHGETLDIVIASQGMNFDTEGTNLKFSDNGIAINSINVIDSENLIANITVEKNAELGEKDIYITTKSGEVGMGFRVFQVLSNTSPTLRPIGNKQGQEGEWFVIPRIIATDQDDDTLTIQAENLPSGTRFFRTASRPGYVEYKLRWPGRFVKEGTYNVTFIASDGNGGEDSETVTITITSPGNYDPTLRPIGNKQGQEGEWFVIRKIIATDPDDDTLTIEAENLPSGARFFQTDSRGGYVEYKLRWPGRFVKEGTYNVTFTASDGNGGEDSEAITITIRGVGNNPPILRSIGDHEGQEGEWFVIRKIIATDPDDDTLTIQAENLPSGTRFFRTASRPGYVEYKLRWPARFVKTGTYDVTFTASDGKSTDSETITITITE